MSEIDLSLWPENQKTEAVGDRNIVQTLFADAAEFHDELRKTILRLERNSSFADPLAPGGCGVKVHHIDRWKSPAASRVHERARMLFSRTLRLKEAHVDACWANIYRNGDYCTAHSHLRSTASIVYMVDEGDVNTKDTFSGKFCIIDPRLAFCCSHEPGRLTRILTPVMRPGHMIMFPSSTVHCVNPYFGRKPRITMSWNINPAPLPGNADDDFRALEKR